MPGSAVLFKEGGKYRKGRFSFVLGVDWEVVEGERYKYLSGDDILILDEKPNDNQQSGHCSRWNRFVRENKEGKHKKIVQYHSLSYRNKRRRVAEQIRKRSIIQRRIV